MTTETNDQMAKDQMTGDQMTREQVTDVMLGSSRATSDILTVDRVFGRAYEIEGRTIIPVASIRGGGGGGGGSEGPDEQTAEGQTATSGGFGSGFGVTARPVGTFVVDADGVEWKPAVDVARIVRGGQVLAGIIAVCLTVVMLRRSPT